MRVFEDRATTGTSVEFGDSDAQQVALNFSVDGISNVSATLVLQALIGGVWQDVLTRTAAGSLREISGGVAYVQADSYRVQITAVQGLVTVDVATISEDGQVDSPLGALNIAIDPVDGDTYQLPDTQKEMIVMLNNATEIGAYTLNLGALGRNRQSLLVRADNVIENFTLTGADIIDNPSAMLFANSSTIFIRLTPQVWSRVV